MAAIRDQFWRSGPGEYLKVFLVCTVLAEAINLLDGSMDYRWLTFVSCYSYGFLTLSCLVLAQKRFPAGSKLSRYLLPAILGFILASILNLMISSWFITGLFHDLMTELLLALAVFSVTVYWLYIIERDGEMRTKIKSIELEQLAKEKALIQSQLSLLQSQIEPHFLFNTIANLKASIQLDPKQAMVIVDHLTDILRQSLKRSKDELLPLSEEIKFCESYLVLQQIRLGSRLQIEIEIADSVDLLQLFPPLLIQPLVENAVLHGVAQVNTVCRIIIRLTLPANGLLRIEVIDNGAGLGQSAHQGHGMGLDNIRQRLRHYYGDQGKLVIVGHQAEGVSSVLTVPEHLLALRQTAAPLADIPKPMLNRWNLE